MHNDWAGFVASRRNTFSGGYNVLVRAKEAHLDSDGGDWVTVCDVHSTCCNHSTRALALAHLSRAEWCEECHTPRNV